MSGFSCSEEQTCSRTEALFHGATNLPRSLYEAAGGMGWVQHWGGCSGSGILQGVTLL